MRFRDAVESPEECEAASSADNATLPDADPNQTGDGAGELWRYVHDTRTRVARVEGRQVLLIKLVVSGFVATILSVGAAVFVTVFFG